MDFPEPINLPEFIATMGRRLGKNIILDQNVSGKIQIIAPKELSAEDSYQVFITALNYMGYTTVETGKIIKVMRIADGQKKENPLVRDAAELGKSDQVLTYYHPLEYLSSTGILPIISPLISTQSVNSMPNGRALIICDSGINVARILRIIKLLDVKPENEQIDVVKISSIDADLMNTKLKEIFKPTAGASKGRVSTLRFLADTGTNAIVLYGSSVEIAQAKEIITQLDTQPIFLDKQSRFYVRPVDFADAAKLAAGLQTLTVAGTPAGENKIFVDIDTNSLLIKGSKDYYRSVDAVLRQLDKKKTLLFFAVDILEISANHGLTLGGAYSASGTAPTPGGDTLRWLNSWQFSKIAPFVAPATGASTTDPATRMAAVAAGVNEGITIAALGENGVNVPGIGTLSPRGLVQLIKTDGDTKSLSSPQLLASDNEQASISVGETLFFKTHLKDKRGTSVNKVEKENVDLELNLKGHIAGSDEVFLEMGLKAQSIISINSDGLPFLGKQTVKQKVLLRQGQTMVVVGFTRHFTSESTSKVPLLGDLPLLGLLFRRQITEVKTGQLAIFLTPYIIRKTSDLAKIKQKYFDSADQQIPEAHRTQPNGNNFLAD
jgi:general secretion pathway protein D